jgi:hypothetical protein
MPQTKRFEHYVVGLSLELQRRHLQASSDGFPEVALGVNDIYFCLGQFARAGIKSNLNTQQSKTNQTTSV